MPETTIVFDTYWRFAAERLGVYLRRLGGAAAPWTDDPVLSAYRFTNAFRIADRVSQYLVREVQYRDDRSQAPDEVFFRTILFKTFNRVATWELLEAQHGPISWQSADLEGMGRTLDAAMAAGMRLYSAAYIMPAPPFGHARKHRNHLALLGSMMADGLPGRIARSADLSQVFALLLGQPGIGRFLAFQYAIDLNYSTMLDFEEGTFVVAGPGALDGIAKCFVDGTSLEPEDVIYRMVDEQERHFERLGLDFPGLFGRRLQPIDCQNLFCEISKYARVAHPEVSGSSGRTRIKQNYVAGGTLDAPFLPPKWGIDPCTVVADAAVGQPRLL